ncbi:arylsulfatase B-like [Wyeomyia smithii]|uniref:arylsulfatase B-like n=1 Tax=Wyeomyia smithii TaxID=174621 RepID=UPI00246801B4|nr:arylsulfatase B-like [Wyeomyia smithii]XP_055526836.1 arylsulfatase B-like [Wyeomyia smithii]XP_055526837.1 arylsulfatase B-like [Wyeomyia smithii]
MQTTLAIDAILSSLFLLLLGQMIRAAESTKRPHIVIILADDMGWNDVGHHGSNQIPTPNIDALAYDGILLNRHYSAPMCTPSRASLMTGRNSINTGMQHYVIDSDEPWGLGLDQKIMPQFFKEAGYKTHLVGKWHLGFFAESYTPTKRGFDNHIGYWGPYIDYWNHTLKMSDPSKQYVGYDMRRNATVDMKSHGTYATDYFTEAASSVILDHNSEEPLFLVVSHLAPHAGNADDPMQAPEETINKFGYISDIDRRIYAAMISKLDDSVGQIFNTLKTKNMLENSIILVMSDNGAPSVGMHSNTGSNYPMKGQKNSPWEGATRSFAALWSPLLQERQRVSNQFVHITDWLPTLASAAGIEVPFSKQHSEIDGIDQWEALSYDTGNPRRVILHVIDEIAGFTSYMENGYKYVNGSTTHGFFDKWFGLLDANDTIPSDGEYFARVLETDIAKWSNDSLTKDTIKHLRKHARIHCGALPDDINFCDPLIQPCLFDIINDPCELNDISHKHPEKVAAIQYKLNIYRRSAAKPRNKPDDPAANPANFGGVWTWWRTDDDASEETGSSPEIQEDYPWLKELEIPPPHSSLPENVRLTVIITIVVIGVVFVVGALIYLSNKNLLRTCTKDKLVESGLACGVKPVSEPKSTLPSDSSNSSDGKMPEGCENSSTAQITSKAYRIRNNLERY